MDDELRKELLDMEARITARIDQRCEQVETKLLTAFHGWARSMEIRVRGLSTASMGFDERLAVAEERISELERRKNLQ
jgi:hypothetical protein